MVFTTLDHIILEEYSTNLYKALTYLFEHKNTIQNQSPGRYEINDSIFYMIQEYETKDPSITPWESHQKYADIQIILEGEENIEFADITKLCISKEYDPERDWIEYTGTAQGVVTLYPNDLVILYPEDGHKPALRTAKGALPVKKCIIKTLLND